MVPVIVDKYLIFFYISGCMFTYYDICIIDINWEDCGWLCERKRARKCVCERERGAE